MWIRISWTIPIGCRMIRVIKMTKILLRRMLKNQGRKKRKKICLRQIGIDRKKMRKIWVQLWKGHFWTKIVRKGRVSNLSHLLSTMLIFMVEMWINFQVFSIIKILLKILSKTRRTKERKKRNSFSKQNRSWWTNLTLSKMKSSEP